MKYKKKPVIIEAIQWDGTNTEEVRQFCGRNAFFTQTIGSFNQPIQLTLHTLEGDMIATVGDYIVCGVDKEYYPCKPYIFEQTYDRCD